MSQTTTNTPQAILENEPKKKSKGFIIVLAVLVIAGSAFGITKYIHAQHHEETDDAQVDASISPVIPRISGYVTEVRVKDNQKVKAGDTMVILDNRNELIKVKQMEAALMAAQNNLHVVEANTAASKANIASFEANVSTVDAQIEAAKVTLRRASQDYDRYANLIKDHSITLQQFEQAEAAKQSAERQLIVLTGQKNAASRQTSAASSQSNATGQQAGVANATIMQREADLENAKLDLSYTIITAPSDGTVSKVNAQVGQLMQAGQLIFSVVSDNAPWVVANFKETQYSRVRPGQKVTLKIDAFPGHNFEGKVSSLSPASGAKFSLLPPDNASGNFVKTVQRMPVKIEFTTSDQFLKDIKPGMNVDVDVHLD
ncbi:MAG: HlyD family secretion protein [Taibaiella sp.]|nr:HlyD family secretion protein [Taibaiella sp.]